MTAIAYIRRETFVSIVINTGLSALFFLAVFGRSGPVPVWGVGAYVFDFAPQGFMIALMATLVPGLLARKARAGGKVEAIGGASRLSANIGLRALLCGVAGAMVGVATFAAVMSVAGFSSLEWWPAFLAKLAFGAVLALAVTPAGLRAEMIKR